LDLIKKGEVHSLIQIQNSGISLAVFKIGFCSALCSVYFRFDKNLSKPLWLA